MKRFYSTLGPLLVMLAIISFSTRSADAIPTDERKHDTIVDIAAGAGQFDTLVAAVKAAGLVDVLSGDGPFTVFAPTDEAFAALGSRTINNLLEPENRDMLQAILTYHVVPGRIEAKDLLSTTSARTVNGKAAPIGLSIGGAAIIKTDIEASNGIIHVIDTVLMPPQDAMASAEAMDVIEAAIERGARLYNNGQAAACAAVYEVAATAILAYDENISQDARRTLRSAMRMASRTHDASDRAWIMRDGLDEAARSLTMGRRMMTALESPRDRH